MGALESNVESVHISGSRRTCAKFLAICQPVETKSIADEVCNDEDEQKDKEEVADAMCLLWIWILHIKLGWEVHSLSQYIAEWDIDLGSSIDSPTLCIENWSQVALAELEPCNEHRWTGNDEEDGKDDEDELPEAEFYQTAENCNEAGAQHAES